MNDSLGHPDAVIVPGTKTTIRDLLAIEETGLAQQIKEYAAAGGTILGVCGGFQMLGHRIVDPEGLEGEAGEYSGLGLLPITTVLSGNKIARQRQVFSHYPQAGLPVDGYEIHQGRSRIQQKVRDSKEEYHQIFDDPNLGIVNDSHSIWGCYLHGIFDNGPWRRSWLNHLRKQRGMSSLATGIPNYREQREAGLNSLANIVKQHLNLKTILSNQYH
jgi:adenosylcobyric acid synthase